jgi:hypothetical protein
LLLYKAAEAPEDRLPVFAGKRCEEMMIKQAFVSEFSKTGTVEVC